MARTYRSTPEPVYANKTAELVKKDGSIIKTDDLQEKLTFDTTPTKNSTNPVTSGGIKNYVDGLMSGALKRSIVETLPVEDIDTNTIYMVLDESASQQGNVYNEYLYIEEAWELIGTTATSGSGVEYIQVYIDGGTLTTEQLTKVFDNGTVKEGVFFRIDNIILVSSGRPREQVFNSTIIDGKYYSMEVDERTGVYTVTEVSVGGSALYKHTIDCEIQYGGLCYPVSFRVEIINDNNVAFTTATLRNFLADLNNDYPCLIDSEDSSIAKFDYISASGNNDIHFNRMGSSYSLSDIAITSQVAI